MNRFKKSPHHESLYRVFHVRGVTETFTGTVSRRGRKWFADPAYREPIDMSYSTRAEAAHSLWQFLFLKECGIK